MQQPSPTQSRISWQPKPMPEGFVETFIRHGWRGIEAAYGSRTSCNKRWIREAGPNLIAARARYRTAMRRLRRAELARAA